MKNKIILIIVTILLTVSCGNDSITGVGPEGGGIGQPPDNKETPETDTESAKGFKESLIKYSKGEYLEEGDKTYDFDEKGDMTIFGGSGGDYTFWGMSPDSKIAYYYYIDNDNPKFTSVSYQDGFIQEYEIYDGDEEMKEMIFNKDENKSEPDDTKLNKADAEYTTKIEEWKNSVKNKGEIKGGIGTYKFDDNGNFTWIYEYNEIDYKLWGAIEENGSLYGLYYSKWQNIYYSPESITLTTNDAEINQGYLDDANFLIMHPKKDAPDKSKINAKQDSTEEANQWKEKITNKEITGYYQSDNSAKYTFSDNGNLTIDYLEDERINNKPTGKKVNKTDKYIFWGATNKNGNLYGLYYIYKYYSYYQNLYLTFNNSGGSENISPNYSDDEIGLLMHPKKDGPDKSKINAKQDSTEEANQWKEKIKDKEMIGKYQESSATYKFNSDGSLILTYTNWEDKEINENYTFWGAKKITPQYDETDLYGLYYSENNNNYEDKYSSLALKYVFTGGIKSGGIDDNILQNIMLGKKTGYDYSKPKNPQNSGEDWKNKVKNKELKERYTTIYAFKLGNIMESGGRDNKTYTWELLKARNETIAIYSKKIDLKDMFGNIANGKTTYYYYGIKLDTANNKFELYVVSDDYGTKLSDWYISTKFNPKPEDWGKMPVQKSDDIDWSKPTISGDLKQN